MLLLTGCSDRLRRTSERFEQCRSNLFSSRSLTKRSRRPTLEEPRLRHLLDSDWDSDPRSPTSLKVSLGRCSHFSTRLLTLFSTRSALMFYVGAVLIVNGRYTFVKMIEVFTLVVFSVTFSSQIMTYRAFSPPSSRGTSLTLSLRSTANDEIYSGWN